MFQVKVLNQEVLKEVLNMTSVIEAVEKAYVLKAQNKSTLFPMVFHEFEPGLADMDIKSGAIESEGVFGLKLVSWFGNNKEKNMPLLIGTTMLFDVLTGAPLAILNADHITGMRTGAAGAIGAKYLARENSESLLMVGTGHIASFEIAATLIAMPNIKKVLIHNPKSMDHALEFENKIESIMKDIYHIERNVTYIAMASLEEAVSMSDIIITATPSRAPLIQKSWVKKGTHFSCIGSDMSGKQELDEALFEDAIVVVDDIEQATHVGETEIPFQKQIVSKDSLKEIGQVILSGQGRSKADDITIFDSTGIAIQDLITSKLALKIAQEKQVGITIEL